MEELRISIIIAAFNEQKHIERCLRSCLNQSLNKDNYEVVVINDGSTDATGQILENFSNEVIVITNEINLGLPTASNKGILAARSQLVVRVDADDYIHHDFLYVSNLFLSMNKNIDSISFDYIEVNENEGIIGRFNSEEIPIACGVVYRKDHLIDVGLYDPTYLMLEDEDFKLRYEKKYKTTRVPLPLYRYRKHAMNMTNNKEKMEEYRKLLNSKHGAGVR